MSKTEEFIELLKQNPTLPVVPMVEGEVVADDMYSYWLGSWGTSEVTEYYVGNEKVHFKSDDIEDVLCDMANCKCGCDKDGNDIYDLPDEKWDELYQSIPWTKAIVVYIGTPD